MGHGDNLIKTLERQWHDLIFTVGTGNVISPSAAQRKSGTVHMAILSQQEFTHDVHMGRHERMDGLGTGLTPSRLMGDKGFVAEARIIIP